MLEWFRRRRPRLGGSKAGSKATSRPAPRLRSREEHDAVRVDLHEFAPAPAELLACAAYVELTIFENLGRVTAIAPTAAAKIAFGAAAEAAIGKHRALVAELERLGVDPAEAMERHRAVVDRFQRLTQGADWTEAALTNHLASGFLDAAYASLATGLPGDLGERVRAIVLADRADGAVVALLLAAMEEQPRLAPRLALWGRRVLGDAMLVARAALDFGGVSEGRRNAAIEPAFAELIAEHTRRMDGLGLAA